MGEDSPSQRSRRWVRYRPTEGLRDEDGLPILAGSADHPADDQHDDQHDGQHDGGLTTSAILIGAAVLVLLVIGPLAVAVVVTGDSGEDPAAAEGTTSSSPTAAPRPEPLERRRVAAELRDAAATPEGNGLPASHVQLSDDSFSATFYEADTGRDVRYTVIDEISGYEVTYTDADTEGIEETLFDLADLDPAAIARVSRDALARSNAPRSYGVLIDYGFVAEEVLMSVVVQEPDDKALIVRYDLAGAFVEETAVE